MEWELTLFPNVAYRHISEHVLQVTHALLVYGNNGVVTWASSNQHKELCRFDQNCKEHKNLTQKFLKFDQIHFKVTGDATVMLFGYQPTEMTPFNFQRGVNFRMAKMKLARGENPTSKHVNSSEDNLGQWLMADHLDGGIPSSSDDDDDDRNVCSDND